MNRSAVRMVALTLGLTISAVIAPKTYAQDAVASDQADENIAYAIGMDAVFYGLAPVLMQLGLRSQTDADKPYDNGQAPVNQMGHARRLYGAKGGTFAIVGPGWKGTLPPEMVQINSPTRQVYVIGRTGVDRRSLTTTSRELLRIIAVSSPSTTTAPSTATACTTAASTQT
ncbi:DUF1254 domain-containing protein [Bradyrhizobium sp. RDM12]